MKTQGMSAFEPQKQTSPRLKVSYQLAAYSDHFCARYQSNQFASVLVLRLRTTSFNDITHIVEYKDREGRHALPLFGIKRFVEWLPRLGEFIQIG